MNNWADFYEQISLKIGVFMAGAAGAFVSFSKHKQLTWLQRLATLACGGFTARYMTPLATEFFHMSENGALFSAFIIGFSGFKSIEAAIDLIRKRIGKD